ncbi:unnamed protein product [Dracunculus medinensis]|uniref:KTSC domain-containing protein n=1 Tax=Dracunculus medinensis TaxID=318479 RepID=A0A0N4U4R0_DRAME|nr:unnamed protein product [Dracunculus medinensis]
MNLTKQKCKMRSTDFRIEPSVRGSVYSAAARYGNDSDYTFLWEKFHLEHDHAERDRIFSGMAYTTNSKHILQ